MAKKLNLLNESTTPLYSPSSLGMSTMDNPTPAAVAPSKSTPVSFLTSAGSFIGTQVKNVVESHFQGTGVLARVAYDTMLDIGQSFMSGFSLGEAPDREPSSDSPLGAIPDNWLPVDTSEADLSADVASLAELVNGLQSSMENQSVSGSEETFSIGDMTSAIQDALNLGEVAGGSGGGGEMGTDYIGDLTSELAEIGTFISELASQFPMPSVSSYGGYDYSIPSGGIGGYGLTSYLGDGYSGYAYQLDYSFGYYSDYSLITDNFIYDYLYNVKYW
jgi:hypothetical protein